MSMNQKSLNQRILQWMEEHFRSLLALCGIFIFSGIAFFSWSQWSNLQNKNIHAELDIFKTKLDSAVKEANNGKNFRDKEQAFYQTFQKKSTQSIYSDKMNEISLEYETNIKRLIHKKVTGFFVIDLADYFYQKGEVQKAQDLLSSFIGTRKPKQFLEIMHMQLISYYMDQGHCDKALSLLDKITNTKSAKVFHAEAFIQKGVCYQKEKKWELAKKMYKNSLEASNDPFHAKTISNYLRILKFDQKLNNSK